MGGRGSGSRLPRGRAPKVLIPAPEPENPTLEKSKDFAELQKYMKDTHNINVADAVAELDFNAVKDNLRGLEEVLNEFPQARGLLDPDFEIGVVNGSEFYAHAEFSGNLKFYKDYFKDADRLNRSYDRDVKTGFHPAGTTAADIMRHEMGHLLERAIIEKAGGDILDAIDNWSSAKRAGDIIDAAYKAIKGNPENKGKTKNQLRREVSGYAMDSSKGATNRHETFAECIADYSKNGENAKPLSKEVWKQTKKLLG